MRWLRNVTNITGMRPWQREKQQCWSCKESNDFGRAPPVPRRTVQSWYSIQNKDALISNVNEKFHTTSVIVIFKNTELLRFQWSKNEVVYCTVWSFHRLLASPLLWIRLLTSLRYIILYCLHREVSMSTFITVTEATEQGKIVRETETEA